MKTDQLLSERGVAFEVIRHRATYDAQRMAQTLHVPGRDVAKTVLFNIRNMRGVQDLTVYLASEDEEEPDVQDEGSVPAFFGRKGGDI